MCVVAVKAVTCPLCIGKGILREVTCPPREGEGKLEKRFADQVDRSNYNYRGRLPRSCYFERRRSFSTVAGGFLCAASFFM